MKISLLPLLAASGLALAACAVTDEPVQLSPDTYAVSTSTDVATGLYSRSQLLDRSLRKAQQYCLRSGLAPSVAHMQSEGIAGYSTQANQVVFRCVPPNAAAAAPATAPAPLNPGY